MIPEPHQRPTLSVEEAGALLGIKRSAAYAAAKRGEIPTIAVGRALRVPTARLRVLLGLDGGSAGPVNAVLGVVALDCAERGA